VNLFFDTSVLVAASSASHPHHAQAFQALNSLKAGGNQGWMSQHSVAEVYAILTGAPLIPRIHPSEALRILEDNLLPHFRVVALKPRDYRDVIREMAAADWRSGKVYDALHLRCARKQPIDRLYTFNVKDFRALAPQDFQDKIGAP
jgi:predicted nucleic acid-binding protein